MVGMYDPVSEFGREIRRRRRDLEMSQDALAQKAGVDRTHLNKIERGRISEPNEPVRSRLLIALASEEGKLASSAVPKSLQYREFQESPEAPEEDETDDALLELAATVRRFVKSLTAEQRAALWEMVEESDKVTDIRDERAVREPEDAEGASDEERRRYGQ